MKSPRPAADQWNDGLTDRRRERFSKSVAHYFDANAARWLLYYERKDAVSSDCAFRAAAVLEQLDRYCPATATRRVADVGCGTGPNLARLSSLPGSGMGIDIAPRMLEFASREVAGRADWPLLRASATSLPLASGKFDAILAVGLLAYFSQPKPVLCELARILKPGGVGVVTFPNRYAWSRIAGFPRSLPMFVRISTRLRLTDILYGRGKDVHPPKRVSGEAYTRRRIEAVLDTVGLVGESITSSGFTQWPFFGIEFLPHSVRTWLGARLQKSRHRSPWRHLGFDWIVVFRTPGNTVQQQIPCMPYS